MDEALEAIEDAIIEAIGDIDLDADCVWEIVCEFSERSGIDGDILMVELAKRNES